MRAGVAALAAAVTVATPCLAAEPFVDTRMMTRHSGKVVPDVLPYDQALGPKTLFLYRHQTLYGYEPGWDKVAGAPKPLAFAAGVSEGSTVVLATRAQAAGEGWAAGAALRNEDSHAYRDGSGTKVQAGYERETAWLGGRWTSPGGTQWSMAAVRDIVDDGKLVNYTLDADYIVQGGARLSVENNRLTGWFNQAGGTLAWGYSHLDADNFTLRAPTRNFRINAVGDHQTWRANGWAAHEEAKSRTAFGLEAAHQYHTAKRYSRDVDPAIITAYWLPGVEVQRGSVWGEHAVTIADTKLEGGLRYDLVSMSANDLSERPNVSGGTGPLFNFSPQQLYDRTYGGRAHDNDSLDHNLSGRLRAEQTLSPTALAYADLSHMIRSPEHAERYTANGGSGTLGEVGNPELEPEKHNKLALGGSVSGKDYKGYGMASPAGAWKLEATGWHDHVEDFAAVDSVHGQPGIVSTGTNNQATVYRNVDAAITGIAAEGQVMLAEHFAMRVNVTGQRGRNLTDHRPLHQIPALETNLFLDTFGGDEDWGWNAGTRLRAVAAKDSVDSDIRDGSGQDVGGPVSGFATLDLYAGLRLGNWMAVSAGVDNVFDKLYREHLKAVPNNTSVAMPNAPGRTWLLRALVTF